MSEPPGGEESLVHSPPRILMAAAVAASLACAAARTRAADQPEAASCISFAVRPGASFTFRFCARNANSYYKLACEPGESLSLVRVLNAIPHPLATLENPPQFSTAAIWLRPWEVSVELDGRTALAAADATFRTGPTSFEPVAVLTGKLQTLRPENIAFSDGFEDHARVAASWQTLSGHWGIHAPKDPLALRTNGPPMFSVYRSDADYCLAAFGKPHWFDLGLRAKIRFDGPAEGGIAFNIRDDENYAAFAVRPAGNGHAAARLIDVSGGKPTVVYGFEPLDLQAGQWHELAVETFANQAWCSVDGQVVCPGVPQSPLTGAGRAGLVAFGAGVCFDDVEARNLVSIIDHLETLRPTLWKAAGEWKRADAALAGSGRAAFTRWPAGSCRIDAGLLPSGGTEGAIVTHSSGSAFYAFGLFGREWQFRRCRESGHTVLASAAAQPAEHCRLSLVDSRGVFRCFVNDELMFEVADFSLPASGGGLLAKDMAFELFRVAEEPDDPGVRIIDSSFGAVTHRDVLGAGEKPLLGELLKPLKPVWGYRRQGGRTALGCDGPGVAALSRPLPGDVRVRAEVSNTGAPAIFICADAQGNGTRLALDAAGANLVLQRPGKPPLLHPLAGGRPRLTLELARRGANVLAYVDSAPLLLYADPQLPAAGYAGIAAEGDALFHSLCIAVSGAASYSFESHSPAWEECGGRWTLHGGVAQGRPPSWIAGFSSGEPAFLWERALRRGDLELSVTVAAATEGFADGEKQTYPIANVLLKLHSSRQQPLQGYTLLLRPDGKDIARLLAGNAVVAEGKTAPPSDGPLRVKISTIDKRIAVTLDDERVLEYDDAEPATEGQVGLGVADSRARFSNVLILPVR